MSTSKHSNQTQDGLTRRRFVQGVAAGSAGLAVAGMLGCSQEGGASDSGGGAAPSGGSITWDMEADFIVCGLGAAGISGAVEASELGMSCIAFEKCPEDTAGGDMRVSAGGLFGGNATVGQITDCTLGMWSAERIQELSDEALTMNEWVEDGGIEWLSESEVVYMPVGNGPGLYQAMMNRLNETDVEVHFNSPVTELIQDPATKEIIGVYADKDGKKTAAKARLGVLVATGGFIGDEKLTALLGVPGLHFYPLGSPYCTGDGLKMAGNVGASMGYWWRGVEYDQPVVKEASDFANGNGVFVNRPGDYLHPSRIYVNRTGKRFMNEESFLTHWKSDTPAPVSFQYSGPEGRNNLENAYVNVPSYMVVDQSCFSVDPMGNARCYYSYARWNEKEGYVWSEDNSVELDKGWIKKADTLEELAGLINVDPATFAAEVAHYNEMCAQGADADFRRPAETLIPFDGGPYYAVELGVPLIYSVSGIIVDEKSRVLNWNDEPIGRLYSAGNVGQNVFTMPLGVQGCYAQARFAARDAATLSSWDGGTASDAGEEEDKKEE